MLAAAAATLCLVVFWLLALAIGVLVPGSAVDPVAGIAVGALIAAPLYRAVRRRSR